MSQDDVSIIPEPVDEPSRGWRRRGSAAVGVAQALLTDAPVDDDELAAKGAELLFGETSGDDDIADKTEAEDGQSGDQTLLDDVATSEQMTSLPDLDVDEEAAVATGPTARQLRRQHKHDKRQERKEQKQAEAAERAARTQERKEQKRAEAAERAAQVQQRIEQEHAEADAKRAKQERAEAEAEALAANVPASNDEAAHAAADPDEAVLAEDTEAESNRKRSRRSRRRKESSAVEPGVESGVEPEFVADRTDTVEMVRTESVETDGTDIVETGDDVAEAASDTRRSRRRLRRSSRNDDADANDAATEFLDEEKTDADGWANEPDDVASTASWDEADQVRDTADYDRDRHPVEDSASDNVTTNNVTTDDVTATDVTDEDITTEDDNAVADTNGRGRRRRRRRRGAENAPGDVPDDGHAGERSADEDDAVITREVVAERAQDTDHAVEVFDDAVETADSAEDSGRPRDMKRRGRRSKRERSESAEATEAEISDHVIVEDDQEIVVQDTVVQDTVVLDEERLSRRDRRRQNKNARMLPNEAGVMLSGKRPSGRKERKQLVRTDSSLVGQAVALALAVPDNVTAINHPKLYQTELLMDTALRARARELAALYPGEPLDEITAASVLGSLLRSDIAGDIVVVAAPGRSKGKTALGVIALGAAGAAGYTLWKKRADASGDPDLPPATFEPRRDQTSLAPTIDRATLESSTD